MPKFVFFAFASVKYEQRQGFDDCVYHGFDLDSAISALKKSQAKLKDEFVGDITAMQLNPPFAIQSLADSSIRSDEQIDRDVFVKALEDPERWGEPDDKPPVDRMEQAILLEIANMGVQISPQVCEAVRLISALWESDPLLARALRNGLDMLSDGIIDISC